MTTKSGRDSRITNGDMSRRKLLNLLMGGLGAGAAAPLLMGQRATPHYTPKVAANRVLKSTGAPPVIWDTPLTGAGNVLKANYGGGYICHQYYNPNNYTYIAQVFDIHNGPEPDDPGVNLGAVMTAPPTSVGNGRFIVTTADRMFVVEFGPNDSTASGLGTSGSYLLVNQGTSSSPAPPPTPISDLFVYQNAVHYFAGDGFLYRIDGISFSATWNSYVGTFTPSDPHLNLTSGIPNRVEIALSGDRLYVSFANNLTAHDLSLNPAPIWFISITPNSSGANRVLATGSTLYVYATTTENGPASILALNANDGSTIKGQALNLSTASSNMVAYQGALYFATANGTLCAYDSVDLTPLPQWPVTFGGDLSKSTLYVADGFAYFADASSLVYAVELSTQGTATVTYRSGVGDALLAEENGVCYNLTAGSDGYPHLVAVDMRQAIHGFTCDSTLMADDYQDDGNGNPQPATPVYRTTITLLDEANCPRANTAIRVWATDDATFSDDRNTYSISPTKYAWVQTDSSGQLAIAVTADDVSCPTLFIWAGFMEQDEAIAIYPDHKTINTLSSTSGGDISNAKTFAGCSMLAATATSNGSCGAAPAQDPNAIANTIRNTMGKGTAQSLTLLRSRNREKLKAKLRGKALTPRVARYALQNASDPYVQYPNSNQNMVHIPDTSDNSATNRPFVLQGAQSFSMSVDQSTGVVSFQPGATLNAAQHAMLEARTVSDPRLVGGILDELKTKVKQLGHKIKSVACVIGADVRHIITTTVETLAPIVISAVEHAIEVVSCFFLSVISDIKHAVEWLSYVFNWDAIKAAHAQIKTQVLGAGTVIRSWVDNNSANGCAAVRQFFQNAKNTIAADLTAAAAKFTGSVGDNQPNGGDTSTIYNYGGAGAAAPASSLQSKFKANAGTGQVTSASTGVLRASAAGYSPSSFLSDFKAMADTLITALQPYASDLVTQLDNLVDDFKTNFSDPKKLIATGLADLILMVNDLAQILLTVIDLVIEEIFKVLANFVDAMIADIQSGLHIPILSPLFKLIFKVDLTMVDLVCWLIAVPTSIISRAISSAAPTGAAPGFFGIAGLISGVLGAVVDAATDTKGSKATSTLSFADWVIGFVYLCTSLPSTFSGSTAVANDIGFVLWIIPTVLGYAAYQAQRSIEFKGGTSDPANLDSKVKKLLGDYGNRISLVLGVTGIVTYTTNHNNPKVAGPKNLNLASAFMTQIDAVAKGILSGEGEQAQLVLGALDLGLELGAVTTGFAGTLLS